jgi:hypothetical protein
MSPKRICRSKNTEKLSPSSVATVSFLMIQKWKSWVVGSKFTKHVTELTIKKSLLQLPEYYQPHATIKIKELYTKLETQKGFL